jgi:hypothetical protein
LIEPIRQFLNMPLPASSATRAFDRRLCRELTRIGLRRQFKPFVYLNWPAGPRAANEKAPPYGGALLTISSSCAPKLLAVLTVLAALLLAGPFTLALRVLLLLTWLVATTLLLTGALVLLPRILVLLLRHLGETPLLDVSQQTTAGGDFGCLAEPSSSQLRNRKLTSETKITLYKPLCRGIPSCSRQFPPVTKREEPKGCRAREET